MIATGFSNIYVHEVSVAIRPDSDGVCVRLALPSDVLFDGFAASEGSALVGAYADQATDPECVRFRNGTYQGPSVGQGLDSENVEILRSDDHSRDARAATLGLVRAARQARSGGFRP